jgi:L-threonylcarbamoyladenylate synthase
VALALLEAFEKAGGKGVAAPSANRFGHVSPTTAAAVVDELADYLSKDDLVLDGGACAVGVESTIIDCTGDEPKVLRPGAVTSEMISESIGIAVHDNPLKGTIRVSGMFESHYAPTARVLLDQVPTSGQGFIAEQNVITPQGVTRLAAPKSHTEFAQILYSALRAADELKLETVVVLQPIGLGIAAAIRDRLSRAAYSDD